MKIVIISNLYPPLVQGGAEMAAFRMANALKAHLQHVSVVTTCRYAGPRSLAGESVAINGVPAYRFYPMNLFHYTSLHRHTALIRGLWHLLDFFNIHSLLMIRRYLRSVRPDVVITHNLMGIGFLIPRLIARMGIVHLHVLHDVQLYNPSGVIVQGTENSAAQRFYRILGYPTLMKWLFARTAEFISPSAFLRDAYRRWGFFKNNSVSILPNPVEIPAESVEKIRRSALRLLYVGQVSAVKGVVGLVDTITKLKIKDLELKIVGLGIDMQSVSKKISHDTRIRLFGWIASERMAPLYADTDIVVVPTMCYDNSPTVIFEALAMGVPVIASDLGGAAEIVRDGVNGWIMPCGDWKSLSILLTRLHADRDAVSECAARTRESVLSLRADRYAHAVLDIIQKKVS